MPSITQNYKAFTGIFTTLSTDRLPNFYTNYDSSYVYIGNVNATWPIFNIYKWLSTLNDDFNITTIRFESL